MIDKCPVTGLPIQSLFTDQEVADFADLDERVRAWFAHGDHVHRPFVREAICQFYQGKYDEAMAALRKEFADINSVMRPEDMSTMTKWYDCIRVGLV